MSQELENLKIAIIATNGFEEVELSKPRTALKEAGATTHIVSPGGDSIKAWDQDHWSDEYKVDVALEDASPEDYDALLIPGGVINPDQLRTNAKAVEFIAAFMHAGKPIAAICHGPQLLIETKELKGRKMTSYKSIKTDLINAGADWVDEEVAVDQGLTTSRNPDDIPAFNAKMIEEFSEGVHKGMVPT